MKTREEQAAAKDRMDAAFEALIAHVTNSLGVDADPALHRRLIEELRRAQEEYLETMK
jgi:hypothetical protein